MSDFLILFLIISVIIAWFTTIFAFIFDRTQTIKFIHHLPLACGMFIVAFFLVANPQQEPGIEGRLYGLKGLCQYLLLPLFIFTPLPYLRKWNHIVLSKTSVFLGAALTANIYFAFLVYGNYYVDQFWLVDGLYWTAGTFVPAFVIYYGLHRGDLFISRTPEEKPSGIEPENETKSPSSETRKNFVILVCLLVFCVPSILIVAIGNTETCGGFNIYSLNQSQTMNRMVIHLNEKDFRNFPRMAPVIRYNKTDSRGCYSSRYEGYTCAGEGSFRCNEQIQFHQYQENILEYQGRYYTIVQTYVV